ncbi:MAG: hypothetical protein ABR521_00295 [Gaiellaceae bacterium]
MSRLLILTIALTATAATSVAIALAALGASVANVTITSRGFGPSSVRITQMDSVRWVNNDTASHSIVFASADGVSCAQPLVIPSGGSGVCQMTKAGKYSYSDPTLQKGKAFRGTIDVQAAPVSLTFAATPLKVTYLGRPTVSGVLSSQTAGETVTVLAQACGQTAPTKIATATTTAGGAFSLVVQPAVNTLYGGTYRNVNSPTTQVNVRPRVRLAKIAPNRYRVRVTAAQSFKGRFVALQRYNRVTARWVFVKSVALRVAIPITGTLAGTTRSSSTFAARQKRGLRLRLVMSKAQVGSCYIAGRSNTITN